MAKNIRMKATQARPKLPGSYSAGDLYHIQSSPVDETPLLAPCAYAILLMKGNPERYFTAAPGCLLLDNVTQQERVGLEVMFVGRKLPEIMPCR